MKFFCSSPMIFFINKILKIPFLKNINFNIKLFVFLKPKQIGFLLNNTFHQIYFG